MGRIPREEEIAADDDIHLTDILAKCSSDCCLSNTCRPRQPENAGGRIKDPLCHMLQGAPASLRKAFSLLRLMCIMYRTQAVFNGVR
jgi:hypothetical protein